MKTKFQVNLGLSRLSVTGLLGFGSSVVSHINGNAFFATPSPALASITTALHELQTASDNATGGGTEETAIQDAKRVIVEQLLTDCSHYVESVANDPSNDGNEIVIIDSAGMRVKGYQPRQKREFSVIAGKLSGSVELFAERVRRGAHLWQITITPADAASWTDAKPTVKASTTISGLTLYTRYYFRHCAVIKGGVTDWENPVSIVVV